MLEEHQHTDQARVKCQVQESHTAHTNCQMLNDLLAKHDASETMNLLHLGLRAGSHHVHGSTVEVFGNRGDQRKLAVEVFGSRGGQRKLVVDHL